MSSNDLSWIKLLLIDYVTKTQFFLLPEWLLVQLQIGFVTPEVRDFHFDQPV